jgi:D-glycero-D-manno-heptose 1,7-bisphosphate phosphatase
MSSPFLHKNRAVFLDRDGVLNEAIIKNGKPYSPASVAETKVPTDVLPSLQSLKAAGFLLICVTNQPDVARGIIPKENIEAIHAHLMKILPLDAIRTCYHDDNDHCTCRKPLPGLLIQAAQDFQIDLQNSFMVGDRWKDIEAGQRAGCKTIWINQQYQEPPPEHPPHFIASNMSEAAIWIQQTIEAIK